LAKKIHGIARISLLFSTGYLISDIKKGSAVTTDKKCPLRSGIQSPSPINSAFSCVVRIKKAYFDHAASKTHNFYKALPFDTL